MLFARSDEYDDNDNENQSFIVVDYMQRVFSVTEGKIVAPYYPVVHDMVEIKGNSCTINAQCLVEDGK